MVRKLRLRAIDQHSEPIRFGFQIAFILLNVWIAIDFYRWVH